MYLCCNNKFEAHLILFAIKNWDYVGSLQNNPQIRKVELFCFHLTALINTYIKNWFINKKKTTTKIEIVQSHIITLKAIIYLFMFDSCNQNNIPAINSWPTLFLLYWSFFFLSFFFVLFTFFFLIIINYLNKTGWYKFGWEKLVFKKRIKDTAQERHVLTFNVVIFLI